MNSDITFSLLNFSAPTEVKSLNSKPSSSQFSKLSATKKQSSRSKKENIESNENAPSNKNVAKNLLSTYNDKSQTNSSPHGILKERNNIFDNNLNRSNLKLNSKNTPFTEVTTKKPENGTVKILKKRVVEPVGVDSQKFSTYQEIIEYSKKTFVKESQTDSCKSSSLINPLKCSDERNFNSARGQRNDENDAGTKNHAIAKKSGKADVCEDNTITQTNAKSCGLKVLDLIKKYDSLSTSFSSLDTSEPKVRRSANKSAPKKLSESITTISSSPEDDKSLYESLSSFFPVKSNKTTKKLVSSTPRCSDVFYSPLNLSGNFESAVSGILKENAFVSKCTTNSGARNSLNDLKRDSELFTDKARKILTDISNKELDVSTNFSSGKRNILKNSFSSKAVSRSSTDRKFDALFDSLEKPSNKTKNVDDKFDCLLKSSGGKKFDSSKSSGSKADSAANSFDKHHNGLKNSTTVSQTSGEENLSDRFKKSDQSRIVIDDLRFRGITFRRHRRQKVLGLQKDFMYDETSSDSCEEELNDENQCPNSEPELRKKTFDDSSMVSMYSNKFPDGCEEELNDENQCPNSEPEMWKKTFDDSSMVSMYSNKVHLSDDPFLPGGRRPRSKQLVQSKQSFSDNSSSTLSKGLGTSKVQQKVSVIKDSSSVYDGKSSPVQRQTKNQQSLRNRVSSGDTSSFSNNLDTKNQGKPSSNEEKSKKLSDKISQFLDDSLSPVVRKFKSKQLLESSKSASDSLSTPLVNGLNGSRSRRKSQNTSSASSEVSKSDSVQDAEKLLNELYGTTWHDKKDMILPRSSVKKKPIKEKPTRVTRQTLNFSSDEDDIEKDVKKQKNIRKKKQSSFIDDSSSSDSGDLNFYRNLSNKLTLSRSKPKLKIPILSSSSEDLPSTVYKKTSRVCSSELLGDLEVSLNIKNGGKTQSDKKGRSKKSPSFVARKTSVLSDGKFKKPGVNRPAKVTPSKEAAVIIISSSDSDSDSPVKGFKKPTSMKTVKAIVNTPLRPDLKKFKITPSKTPVKELPKLSFLASLSATADENRLHQDAAAYKKFYKTKKEELARRLLILINKEVFESRLPDDMLIQWNARMRSTSGFCYNKKVRRTGIEMARISRIVLSTKILDTPERLRDTLLHELCHAAAWIISGSADGHGPLWKSWANKAMRRFPEVPPIKRCHDYSIKTKFTYRCTSCGYSIGRHSKSLDTTRKRCGHCYGAFELLVNHSKSNRKSAAILKAPREPGKFALFVKENYSEVKNLNVGKTHAEIMKILGQQFSAAKNQEKKE